MKTKRIAAGIFLKDGLVVIGEQIPFVLTHAKALYRKAKNGFIWIREDGKQKVCRDMRALAHAIMDFDGHLLEKFIAQATKIRMAR